MAGMLILFINIVGGFVIGVLQHDLVVASGGQQLHPADRRRRPGGADPGAADLGRRRRWWCRASARTRTSARRSCSQLFDQPAGAGHHRRHRRPARPDPGHAAPGVPAASPAAWCGWPGGCAAAPAAPAPAAARRAGARRASRRGRTQEASWDDLAPVDTLGPGGRLPADPAGGPRPGRRPAEPHQGRAQEVRAGRRLPAAGGAHPRQPRAQAQRLPRHAARRGESARARPSRACCWPSTPGGATRQLPGTHDHAIRPSACRRCGSRTGQREQAQMARLHGG